MSHKNIGFAVDELKAGKKLTRAGWNGKGMYLELRMPTAEAAENPSVWLYTVDGTKVPWTCSQSDLLAEDWMIVE